MNLAPSRPLRRNQSSEVVRFVLWLTVVVAMGVGWGIEHYQTAGPLQELAEYKRREALRRREEAAMRETMFPR